MRVGVSVAHRLITVEAMSLSNYVHITKIKVHRRTNATLKKILLPFFMSRENVHRQGGLTTAKETTLNFRLT